MDKIVNNQIMIMKKFKESMLEFLDELTEQYPQEGDLIVLRFFIDEQIPLETLIEQFIKFVVPFREKIEKKDESFFLENDNIFGSSPKDKVIHFKGLYLGMNKEDRLVLYDWFKSFLDFADKYALTVNQLATMS